LFHGFDTLGSHLREEGSLGYDGGLVRLRVQTKLDTHLHRQHKDMQYQRYENENVKEKKKVIHSKTEKIAKLQKASSEGSFPQKCNELFIESG
jgi:hypothetical protein